MVSNERYCIFKKFFVLFFFFFTSVFLRADTSDQLTCEAQMFLERLSDDQLAVLLEHCGNPNNFFKTILNERQQECNSGVLAAVFTASVVGCILVTFLGSLVCVGCVLERLSGARDTPVEPVTSQRDGVPSHRRIPILFD